MPAIWRAKTCWDILGSSHTFFNIFFLHVPTGFTLVHTVRWKRCPKLSIRESDFTRFSILTKIRMWTPKKSGKFFTITVQISNFEKKENVDSVRESDKLDFDRVEASGCFKKTYFQKYIGKWVNILVTKNIRLKYKMV